jgi:hypothetical protein
VAPTDLQAVQTGAVMTVSNLASGVCHGVDSQGRGCRDPT